jgi:hypothetical protein
LCRSGALEALQRRFRRQMKLSFDAGDRCRRNKLAVGVKDKEIAWPVEDDAAARPVFV